MPKTRDVSELNSQLQRTPIAITGLAALFAQANNLQEYWENILRKVDSITDVPPSRWKLEDYYDPDPRKPDKTYSKRGGFIPDIDFDPMEFGLPPNILEVTDILQLLSLHVARQVLNDAGYGEGKTHDHSRTGVILGIGGTAMTLFTPLAARLEYPVWEKVMRAYGIPDADIQKIVANLKLAYVPWEENSFPGVIANVVAGRIANRFDFGGTNCTVDAACGSSIAAAKFAVTELVEHRADLMLTGGADANNTPIAYTSFSKTPAFTLGSNLRVFDASSDGMLVGEGLGMLALKRLEDAERDGDRIYAVIRGVGSSSDGKYKSIYAPSAAGQAAAVRRAYEDAGFPPSTVTLIEAHGTGTPVGDPVEVEALTSVIGENNPEKQVTGLGSVKGNIGHTKAAAGSAGMVKTALALYHKILPPTINVTQPNPKLGLENTPFYINSEPRPWLPFQPGLPRRAGVSAFGFGGTNFHIVLEEYTGKQENLVRLHTTPRSVFLTADSPTALQDLCQKALADLGGEGSEQDFTSLTSLPAQAKPAQARLGFLAASVEEARSQLQAALGYLKDKAAEEAWEHPSGIFYRKSGLDASAKIVALFPGQGAQYVDMGKELAMNFPLVRQTFSEMDSLCVESGDKPLSQTQFPIPAFDQAGKDEQTKKLTRTENAQPAIGVFSAALFRLLRQAGFKPDFTAGHSFGELTALWAGGVYSDRDFFFLARSRGKAMQAPNDPAFDAGTMLAVKGDAASVREEIKAFPAVTLANWNSNDQVVLAGAKPEIAAVQKALQEKGYSTTLLQVSAAFHTPLVKHAQQPFAQAIQSVKFNKPATPVFSNTTGKQHSDNPAEIQKLLVGHILNPVLFKDEVESLYAAGGTVFVEIGPRNILTNLVNNILADKPHLAVALVPNPKKGCDRQMREAVLLLQVAGLALSEVDTCQAPYQPRKAKKTPTTVTLNGAQYVSPKTRGAFEKALAEPAQFTAPQVGTPAAPAAPGTLQSLERSLEQFNAYQMELLRVQAETTQAYANLIRQQMEQGGGGVPIMPPLASPADVIPPPVTTAPAVPVQPAPAPSAPPTSGASGLDSEAFSRTLLEVVSEKTGYPREMLNPDMDMEADLGIDSIKRVEILGTIQEKFPALPKIEMEQVAGLKTLNQIIKLVVEMAPAAPAPSAPPPAVTPPAEPPPAATSTLDSEAFSHILLEVVSEKTGYPKEMLNPDMDMEADLGIDSIKRVEILGAMQEKFPDLPKAEMETIAGLHTLRQITDFFQPPASGQ